MTKQCTKCLKTKSLSDFYKDSKGALGRFSRCKNCIKIYTDSRKKAKKIYDKKRQKEKAHIIKAKRKKHYEANKERILARTKKWAKNNPEKRKKICRRWSQNNKQHVTYLARKYQCRKLKATPSWVDQKAIKEIYINCPEGYVVDHIVPLKGKTVSGLHVPWNLQYLTPSENSKKSNKLILE